MSSENSLPEWIFDRAFGGAEVAATPSQGASDSKWPEGPSTPYAEEACSKLVDACRSRDTSRSRLVFLVGGAGNGKSYMSAQVVSRSGAQRTHENTKFAQRTYEYLSPSGLTLRVVNDATIPPASLSPGALREDIRIALEHGQHMLACANRGVLIGELREEPKATEGAIGEVAYHLIGSLLQGQLDDAREFDGWKVEPIDAMSSDHRELAIVSPEGFRFDVSVVFMDHASLLEPLPDRATGPRSVSTPPVAPIIDKESGYKPRNAAFEGPLKELANRLIDDAEGAWPGQDVDPILANAKNFSNEELVDSWCRCLRGAEVIGGFNFSYRELWGLASLSIAGPNLVNGIEARSRWIKRKYEDLENAKDDLEKCKILVSLAQLRSHLNLFGGLPAPIPLSADEPEFVRTRNDATAAATAADPLRDLDKETSPNQADIFARIQDGKTVGEIARELDPRFEKAWTPLDDALDKAICKLVDPMSVERADVDRSALLSWYSQYLLRLHGLSTGRPAFAMVVNEWQRVKIKAYRQQKLNKTLASAALKVVLPPAKGSEGTARLPFMRPRVTNPASGEAHLAIEVDPREFKVELKLDGERPILSFGRIGHEDSAETALDFHLLREALARSNGEGFTDSLRHVEPRLERLRARIVALELSSSGDLGNNTVFVATDGHVIYPQ